MDNNSISFSKKGERKISGFVAQELLYDYVTFHLDPERMKAVEEYVKASHEAQADIQLINDGLDYVERLSEIHVSDALLETLKTPSSYLQVLLRKLRFEEWSPGIKMGLEVMIVAVGVISISLVIPWHKLMELSVSKKKDVVLTEVQKTPMAAQDVEVAGLPEEATVVFPDEGKKNTEAPKSAADIVVKKNLPLPPPPPSAVNQIATNIPTTEKQKSGQKSAVAKATVDETNSEKKQGYLYRGIMKVTNAEAVSTKFVEKINELGGRKAGEVELGWKKGNANYFHFTMPEAKYQAFLEFTKKYGGLSLQKEKHDRLMPEGIVRIIFSLEEK